MIVLLIILAFLVLLMLTKVGIDAAYKENAASLTVRVGPVRSQMLPKPQRSVKGTSHKNNKKKKTGKKEEKPEKQKKKPDISALFGYVKIGLHALDRFRISLRIDSFRLRFIMASDDPYTTAMTYGYIQTAVGILTPMIRRTFTVRESHVELGMDFMESKPEIEARLELSIRIGRILRVLFAAGFEFLRFHIGRRQKMRRKAKTDGNESTSALKEERRAQKSA